MIVIAAGGMYFTTEFETSMVLAVVKIFEDDGDCYG
jgi:hypothetical protein